jgi:hypothetical protein
MLPRAQPWISKSDTQLHPSEQAAGRLQGTVQLLERQECAAGARQEHATGLAEFRSDESGKVSVADDPGEDPTC